MHFHPALCSSATDTGGESQSPPPPLLQFQPQDQLSSIGAGGSGEGASNPLLLR